MTGPKVVNPGGTNKADNKKLYCAPDLKSDLNKTASFCAYPHEDVYNGLPPHLGLVLDCGGKYAGHGRGTVERYPAVGRWGGDG